MEETFYRETFRNAPIGIAVSDGQGYVVDANDYLLELGGWKREELEGMTASDFYVDGPTVRRTIIDSMKNRGRLEDHGVRFKRKDGSAFMASMSVRPITIGDTQYIIAIIRKVDIEI